MKKKPSASWENSHQWYNQTVGASGHYYHEKVILPKLLPLLALKPGSSLLDIGCGQGILARHLPKISRYVGLDVSKGLIQSAKSFKNPKEFFFRVHDVTTPLPQDIGMFSHAAIVLALQNMQDPQAAISHAFEHLEPKGQLAIVLNHPCFRIPRMSGWLIDPKKKLQSRRIDRYMSPLEIPIDMHPGKKEDLAETLSLHHPLSFFIEILKKAGFCVLDLQEWCSDKKSSGKMAVMEDRARDEFPLFLTILAEKL